MAANNPSRSSGPRSRGCQICKTRRIKCDETKPACIRCQRTGRVCPGYLSPDTFVFRDQSAVVRRRYTRPADSPPGLSPSETNLPDSNRLVRFSPTFSLQQQQRLGASHASALEQGVALFAANYLRFHTTPLSDRHRPLGYLSSLPKAYSRMRIGGCLDRAVNAVGLALLAKEKGGRRQWPGSPEAASPDGRLPIGEDPGLARLTKTAYAATLTELNVVLADEQRLQEDETLLAIELLSLYETLSADNSALRTTNTHVIGACEIIRMRGPSQLRTEIGLSLFLSFRIRAIMLGLMQRMDRFPFIAAWSGHIPFTYPAISALATVAEIPSLLERFDSLATGQLQHSLLVDSIKKLSELANAKDTELRDWEMRLPPHWKPIITPLPAVVLSLHERSHPSPFRDEFHEFPSVWSGLSVNLARIGRIYLHILQRDCSIYLSVLERSSNRVAPASTPEHSSLPFSECSRVREENLLERHTTAIHELVLQISRTVAFNLGCRELKPATTTPDARQNSGLRAVVDRRIAEERSDRSVLERSEPRAFGFSDGMGGTDEEGLMSNARGLGGMFIIGPLSIARDIAKVVLPGELAEWMSGWVEYVRIVRGMGKVSQLG